MEQKESKQNVCPTLLLGDGCSQDAHTAHLLQASTNRRGTASEPVLSEVEWMP